MAFSTGRSNRQIGPSAFLERGARPSFVSVHRSCAKSASQRTQSFFGERLGESTSNKYSKCCSTSRMWKSVLSDFCRVSSSNLKAIFTRSPKLDCLPLSRKVLQESPSVLHHFLFRAGGPFFPWQKIGHETI